MLCKFIFTILIFFALGCGYSAAYAQPSPPASVTAALELWHIVAPDDRKGLFDSFYFRPITGENAPLARYRPENGGGVEIGQNLREYKRDYIYLSSNQDMSTKPDFEQYLTVLITLSLGNESAHALQDKNNSLKDFYKFYEGGQLGKACALYALQQHVSDIVMLKIGMTMENLFLGKGSTKGINALRIALEKNDLRDEFEDFREAMRSKDTHQLDDVLHRIRSKRNEINLSGLSFCQQGHEATLPDDVIGRAIAPAGYPFTTSAQQYSPTTKKNSLNYNQ